MQQGRESAEPASAAADAESGLLHALMDTIPDRIYFKDLQSRFIFANRATARYFGISNPKQIIGKTDSDFFSEAHAGLAHDDDRHIISTGQPVLGVEERETWPDGRITWCSTTKMPLRNGSGRIVGTFGISRDITERKHFQEALAESEERFRQLLNAVPSYTYSVGIRDGKPETTSHSIGCLSVTGYSPADYEANPFLWLNMVHDEDRGMVKSCVERILQGEVLKPIEHRILHKAGGVRWVRSTIVQHYDSAGRMDRYDGLIEDITERKHAERALASTLAEMEDRVRSRTAELQSANEDLKLEVAERKMVEAKLTEAANRLRSADEAKMQFVFGVSHDLKTPVVALRYAVDNLLRGMAGPVSGGVRAYLEIMARDVQRLTRTIQGVLDMSRIESDTMTLTLSCVAVDDLLRSISEELRVLADGKQQKLILELDTLDEKAEWDLLKMERAIINVIENAIKYTPKGGTVSVGLSRIPDLAGVLAIEVRDTGTGIPPEHLGKVTERYYRVNHEGGGVGLGLAISREIVELHSGQLRVESPPPGETKGTRVTMLVPFKPRPGRN